MKRLTLPLVAAVALFAIGCKNTSPTLGPALVQQGVATGVSYSVIKYTNAIPYLKVGAQVVCASAGGTNISPAAIITALEQSSVANSLKTPEGVLIFNSALLLYTGIWESYGSNAVASVAQLQPYLQATCNGMNQGLAYTTLSARNAPVATWPKAKF
jgi:hypothetical protein